MIVERTHYYAKPGLAEQVLAIRRRATLVRIALGLPAGKIRAKAGGDGPDVTWECAFASEAEHTADLAARARSADFEASRADMRAAVERFERCVERDAGIGASHWSGDHDLVDLAIVPEEIRFRSAELELVGYLYRPPGPGPFPCMVTNHGSGITQGTQDVCRPGTAALLMSWGIASFLPHRRGYGNSSGTPWRTEVSAEFGTAEYDAQLVRRLDHEADDVVAALHMLLTQPDIVPEHIGVMGSSFGGVTTLISAAKSDRFRCAVEFAGAAMNWERTPTLRATMLAAAKALSHPIFFIQAANDYSIGPTLALAQSLEEAGKTVESKIYPQWGLTREEGHLFESRGQMIWSNDVRRFLERWL
jgi:dipeptidyl aminopeptidase/acylaminoacyl peptidase